MEQPVKTHCLEVVIPYLGPFRSVTSGFGFFSRSRSQLVGRCGGREGLLAPARWMPTNELWNTTSVFRLELYLVLFTPSLGI